MKECTVSIVDGHGETHVESLTASSLFDAAEKAIAAWARLWWWADCGEVLKVQIGDRSWSVRAEDVRKWRQEKQRTGRNK